MVEVTVVIPTRNRRVLLARTLHSVLAQQDVDLQVIIVDDGGSDETAAAVARLRDDRVEVVRHATSGGVSAARNTGIDRAAAPWVAFVDDDDLWSPRKLRSQLDALAADTDAGWSCTGAVHIDERCVITGQGHPPDDGDVAALMLRVNAVPGGGSGVVASRDLALSVGGFDVAMSNLADWDFYVRLALHARLASVPAHHVGYFIHVQGMAHDVKRSALEHDYLRVKYGRERRAFDVELDDEEWLAYLSSMAFRGGHRWAALRMHVELLAKYGRLMSVPAVVIGLLPPRLRQLAGRVQSRLLPPTGGAPLEALEWLEPYASGWLEPTVAEAGGRYDPRIRENNPPGSATAS